MGDRTKATDAAFDQARKFIRSQADAMDELPADFAKDALAYYFLGRALYGDGDAPPDLAKVEKAYRQSISIDPKMRTP